MTMGCPDCGTPLAPKKRRCDDCKKERRRIYDQQRYSKNREAYIKKARDWSEKNWDRCVELARENYRKNPERGVEAARRWRLANPEKAEETRRRAHFKNKYGLSLDEYRAKAEEQRGRCAICGGIPETKGGRSRRRPLDVDHCHETGTVRGLLCNGCNRGLGAFKDDPDRLTRAIEYLAKWSD